MSQSAWEELMGFLDKGPETQTKDPAINALLKLNLTPDHEMIKNVHVRAFIIMQAGRIFKEGKLTGKRTTEGLKLYPLRDFRGFAYEAASLIEADNIIKDASLREREISRAFDQARFSIIDSLAFPLCKLMKNRNQTKGVAKGLRAIFQALDSLRENIRIETTKKTDLKANLFLLLQSYVPNDTPDFHIDNAIFLLLGLFGIHIRPRTTLKVIERKAKKEPPPIK